MTPPVSPAGRPHRQPGGGSRLEGRPGRRRLRRRARSRAARPPGGRPRPRPLHSTTEDGTPSQVPPSRMTAGWSAAAHAAATAPAVVAGSSPCRLALVTARGPSIPQRATTTGWSGRRTPTVRRAGAGPPRSAVNDGRRSTTSVRGPGQNRSASASAAALHAPGDQVHLFGAGHEDRDRDVGGSALQPEQQVDRVRLRRIDRQPVDGVGRDGHHRSPGQGLCGPVQQRHRRPRG